MDATVKRIGAAVVTALGASRGRLFVLDAKRISAFEFSEGRLLKKSFALSDEG